MIKWFAILLIVFVFFKTADAQILEGKWYLFDKDGQGQLVELTFSKEKITAEQFTVDSLGKLHQKKDDEPPLVIKHIEMLESHRLVYVADMHPKRGPDYIALEVRQHTRSDERLMFIPLEDQKITSIDSALNQIDSIDRRRSVLYSRRRLDEILKMKRLGDVSKETYITLLEHQATVYKQFMDDKKKKRRRNGENQIESALYEEMISLDINPFCSHEYIYNVRRTMEKDPVVGKTARRIEKELNEYGK